MNDLRGRRLYFTTPPPGAADFDEYYPMAEVGIVTGGLVPDEEQEPAVDIDWLKAEEPSKVFLLRLGLGWVGIALGAEDGDANVGVA